MKEFTVVFISAAVLIFLLTVLAERILVPLIATPAAEQVEKRFFPHPVKQFYTNPSFISFSDFENDIANGKNLNAFG